MTRADRVAAILAAFDAADRALASVARSTGPDILDGDVDAARRDLARVRERAATEAPS